MATTAQIQLWTTQLADAEAAYHRIMIGGHVQRIRLADREVQNSPANLNLLRIYINELRGLLELDPLVVPRRFAARRIIPV